MQPPIRPGSESTYLQNNSLNIIIANNKGFVCASCNYTGLSLPYLTLDRGNSQRSAIETLGKSRFTIYSLGLLRMLLQVLKHLQIMFESFPTHKKANKIYRQNDENYGISSKHIFDRNRICNHCAPLLHYLKLYLIHLLG